MIHREAVKILEAIKLVTPEGSQLMLDLVINDMKEEIRLSKYMIVVIGIGLAGLSLGWYLFGYIPTVKL